MGYYTGQVFEIITRGFGSSVAGGGRYDKLIGRWLGRDVPACGFSIGFERITDLLATRAQRAAVAVLTEPDVHPADALAAARRLRDEGHVTEVIRRSGKLPAQLTRLEGAASPRSCTCAPARTRQPPSRARSAATPPPNPQVRPTRRARSAATPPPNPPPPDPDTCPLSGAGSWRALRHRARTGHRG